MSHPNERPKLKAKRFNKFSSSARTYNYNCEENNIRHGTKRTLPTIGNDSFMHKRMCVPVDTSPALGTKNLANNRLKMLRDNLKTELKTKPPDKPIKNETVTTFVAQTTASTTKENKKDDTKINVSNTTYNKNTPVKNLANQRLQCVRKSLELGNKPQTQTTSTEIKFNTSTSFEKCSKKVNHNLEIDHNETQSNCTSSSVKVNISITNQLSQQKAAIKDERKDTVLKTKNKSPSKNFGTEDTTKTTVQKNATGIKRENSFSEESASLVYKKLNVGKSPVLNICTEPKNELNQTISPLSQRLAKAQCKNIKIYNDIKSPATVPVQQTSNTELQKKSSLGRRLELALSNLGGTKSTYRSATTCNPSTSNGGTQNVTSTSNTAATQNSGSLWPIAMERNAFTDKMIMTSNWVTNVDNNTSFNTTSESMIAHVNDSTKLNDTEEMEWTNAEPDDSVIEIPSKHDEKSSEDISHRSNKSQDICIVVDTNIFLGHLNKIRDVLNLKATDLCKPIIYIPWMVITELDYMKDKSSDPKLKKTAFNAIKFINDALNTKDSRLIGQTVMEVGKQKQIGISPDDKIISCCMQISKKYETVMLLSNDINLKNKAIINDILACSANDVMIKVMSKLTKNTKFQKIVHKMGMLCSCIICDCAKETYGKASTKMDMLRCPPWSLMECLKRFKRYWPTVFQHKLLKQFTKTVEDLLKLLSNRSISDDSTDYNEFMKHCIALCVYLKDIEECKASVENALKEITKLG